MAKKTKSKRPSRKKRPNPEENEASVAQILGAYGLGVGCTLSDSDDSSIGSDDNSPTRKNPSSTFNASQTRNSIQLKSKSTKRKGQEAGNLGFAVSLAKHAEGPRPDHSIVDMHLHSTCSDGLLSPTELVRKAAGNGLRIMALTDHDTMDGVEEAAAAGAALGVRIIPGVEISSFVSKSSDPSQGEGVHILAYFPAGGPGNHGEFHQALLKIRTGRFDRAKSMVEKLRALRKPVKLSRVMEIAGPGVAPGRPHVARALVEAGHVATEGDAFGLYLRDQGPAFARGSEIPAIEAIALIRHCGGLAVLAHPWSIRKDPMAVVGRLAAAGLDGIEVYQDFTKITAYSPLADLYKLLRTGGSDFHGTGAADEREPGKIPLPVAAVEKMLLAARPIWDEALRSRVRTFVQEEGGETSTGGSSEFLDGRENDVPGTVLQGREGRDRVGETSGQGDGVQGAEVQSESARNKEGGGSGAKYMTWTYTEREGRRALVSPLLLTRSDREAVVCEAEQLRCCVEQSEWNGYKYLVLLWK